jgi:hypothetical protein
MANHSKLDDVHCNKGQITLGRKHKIKKLKWEFENQNSQDFKWSLTARTKHWKKISLLYIILHTNAKYYIYKHGTTY